MIFIFIYLLVHLLVGSITCLFGKKLYVPVLMLTVFSTVITISLSLFDLSLMVGMVTIIVGLLLAVLVRYVYELGVFLIGCVLGGVFSLFVIAVLPSFIAGYGWLISLLLVLIFGCCAVKWCDFFIIISTSFNGAFSIATLMCFLFFEIRNLKHFIYVDDALSTMVNLNQYLNGDFSIKYGSVIFIITLIIALGGIGFQMVSERRESY